MLKKTILGLCTLLTLAAAVFADSAPLTLPIQDQLVAIGEKTAANIKTDGAAWTVRIDMHNGAIVSVQTIIKGEQIRWHFTFEGITRVDLGDILQRDHLWYVTQRTKKEKYLPHEAVMFAPNLYLWWKLSDLHLLTKETHALTLTQENGKIVTRQPLAEANKKQLENAIAQIKTGLASGALPKEKFETQIALLADLIAHGTRQEIDPATGLIMLTSSPKMTLTVSEFRPLTPADLASLQVNPADYVDQTAPIADDMNDVAMLFHSPAWRPAAKNDSPDMDISLVNLKTGAERRLPVAGPTGIAGSFSPDRQSVWISGVDLQDGRLRPMSVDLKSRKTTVLPWKAGQLGTTFFIDHSWDGRYLSFAHQDLSKADVLHTELVVEDLQTGEEKIVGPMADYGETKWAAGNLLITVKRDEADFKNPAAMNNVQPATICSIDLAGKITPLLPGHHLVVVDAGKTILFNENSLWSRCDLDGKNAQIIGDGLPKCRFASSSPDGSKALMIYVGDFATKGPKPVIVDWKTGNMQFVPVSPGLWTMPAWR